MIKFTVVIDTIDTGDGPRVAVVLSPEGVNPTPKEEKTANFIHAAFRAAVATIAETYCVSSSMHETAPNTPGAQLAEEFIRARTKQPPPNG